jgi:hypothetical protein
MPLLRHPRKIAPEATDIAVLRINFFDDFGRPRKLLLPCVDRLGTYTQPRGHLAHRITPILNLGHSIAFELVCEFACGHLVLLASKVTKQGGNKSKGYSNAPSD